MPLSPDVRSSSALGETGAGTGGGAGADRLKLNESRVAPMLSAGSAGTSSTEASFSPAAELPLGEASFAGASLAADLAAVRTDEAPRICVGSSVSAIRSSSSCCSVTTVGEAPPEPSDVFVRLSKPSSYDLTLTRLSLDETPMPRRRLSAETPRQRDTDGTLGPRQPLPLPE